MKHMSDVDMDALAAAAAETGMSLEELLAEAVREYLAKHSVA